MNFIERLIKYGKAPGSLWLANTVELKRINYRPEMPATVNQMTAQGFEMKITEQGEN